MFEFIKKQSPVRVIALGFALVILLGSVLLIMPFSVQEGVDVAYIDTLYTSTSAVCVTGLIACGGGHCGSFRRVLRSVPEQFGCGGPRGSASRT